MQKQAPLTIRKTLLIAFLLAGLLPALLITALSFYQARLALRTEIKNDLQTTGEAVAEHIDRVLFERVQNVRSWGQLAIMQDMQIGDIDKRLSVFLEETQNSYVGQYVSIDVIDLQSIIIASSNPRQINQHLTIPPVWFAFKDNGQPMTIYHLQDDQLMISTPIISTITSQPVGHLMATFNWSVIQDLLDHASQHATVLSLFDEKKRLLAQSGNWTQQRRPSLPTHVTMKSSTLPIYGWEIKLNKEHDVAVAPVHRLGLIFLILLVLILFFSLILVRPIAKKITQPLEDLIRFVQQLRQPNVTIPPLSGPVEVQALHQTFTKMAADLAESEQQLMRAAKLAVVGEMAAAMSHEVRTPLGIMRSSADVLKREPSLSDDGHEVLGFIISETERLNKLVTTLIDSARPRLPSKTPLELQSHLQHVCDMLKKQAQDKHIQLSLHAPEPVTIPVDQDQMTQVMMNLIINAIQILPEHGQVTVSLKHDTQFAYISVADNGPGVPPAQQTYLFEAFFTQRAGGVGLGLAVVKQLVEAHGGTITYSTSPWQGAQFNLALPLNPER